MASPARKPATLTLAPDWVRKLPAYARHGVGHSWLMNPSTRTLEVYRRDGGSWVLAGTHAADAIVCAEPFEAIELDLLRLWGEDRPTQAG
jgi:hypothetical protein